MPDVEDGILAALRHDPDLGKVEAQDGSYFHTFSVVRNPVRVAVVVNYDVLLPQKMVLVRRISLNLEEPPAGEDDEGDLESDF